MHAANSIANTHERQAVSFFTEEQLAGGSGLGEGVGELGDDTDASDRLFSDLLNGGIGGDNMNHGSEHVFHGLPEMDDEGGGFLVDHGVGGAMGRDGHREVKIEDTTAPRNVEQNQSYVKREPSLDKDGRPTRDSAGSAAGPKHEDVGSGSDVSHGLGGNVNSQGIRQGGAGPNNGNLGNGGGGNFALTMDDYASLERVGNVDVDDFLGPIMDDNAIVGFGEEQQQWAHTSMPGGFGGAHDANLVAQASAQARAQADARAMAMQHARTQGMQGGVNNGSSGSLQGMGKAGDASRSGMPAGGMPGGAIPAMPPGTHGMPPPSFGGPGLPGGPPGGPPGPPGGGMRGPGGMMYFSGPPLPMLHLANGQSSNAPPSRLERLRRWKEKRKNRNFNKTIRYQSRKVCADNRPRIKGKFVKVGSTPDLGAMDDLGADFDGARNLSNPHGHLGELPEEQQSVSEDTGSEGVPVGQFARMSGLKRGGGLTASMSVPAGLAMMGGGGCGSES